MMRKLVVFGLALVMGACSSSDGQTDATGGGDLGWHQRVDDGTPCLPECGGKACGDDGCGGICGKCFTPEGGQDDSLCTDNGTCCVPTCGDHSCGDNGCGGLCGVCPEGVDCLDGYCADSCVPDCAGKDCGDDGCQGSCGNCLDKSGAINNDLCQDGLCCVPECGFKKCGNDGCGGSCGACSDELTCVDGVCKAVCIPDCVGKDCGYDGCTGVCGSCQGGKTCQDHQCVPCDPDCTGKDCGGDGCGGLCGNCEPGSKCQDGLCQCVPQCKDLECGDDTCGGSCGQCDDGNPCTADSCDGGVCVYDLLPLEEITVTDCLCASDSDCAPLEDGDLCNGVLYCDQSGEVSLCNVDAGTILDCDDDNPCTDDSCDAAVGCQFVNNDALACGDDDVCNGVDSCLNGACVTSPGLSCDDGDVCTTDSCDATDGCQFVPIEGCGEPVITWTEDILPVVQQKCAGCHLGGGASGGLAMDTLTFKDQASNACNGLSRGEALATKIRPDWSASCSGSRMPLSGGYLSVEVQELFADWVTGGMQE